MPKLPNPSLDAFVQAYRARVREAFGRPKSGSPKAKALKLLTNPRRFTGDMLRKLPLLRDLHRAPDGANTPTYEEFQRDVSEFLALVKCGRFSHLVVMLSGTTYIQDIRANRPIRITRELVRSGIPVLFSFHRWRENEHMPPYPLGSLVLQSPVDFSLRVLPEIAGLDLGEVRPILVVSYPHPSFCRALNRFNSYGWPTLYDVRDDWQEFSKVGQAAWYSEAAERYIANNCDTVMCVSRPLVEKLRAWAPGRPVHLSPNAYDTAFLAPGYERAPTDPPVVGYFGHLTASWFAWDDLAEIARALPRFRFEIIGHGEPDDLRLPDNVELLGKKTHPEICAIAARWSVAIIPFKMSRLADGVDPIKIYEYFSLGLPVVSFRMPQIDDYPYTTTVESVADFVAALERAAASEPDPAILQEFLRENTWQHRADQILRLAADAAKTDIAMKSLQQSEVAP